MFYSRIFLLFLCAGWKSTPQAQQSYNIQPDNSYSELCTNPLSADIWRAMKELGILRRFRGKRAGRLKLKNTNGLQIEPLYLSISVIEKEPGLFHMQDRPHSARMAFTNFINIKKQLLSPKQNTSKSLVFTLLNSRSISG